MSTKTDAIEEDVILKIEEGSRSVHSPKRDHNTKSCCSAVVSITKKLIAEVIGTYFVIFSGCGAVAVNKIYGSITFPGVCVTWGLIVMVMVYAVGHISGGHFNPAVTITFAIFGRCPLAHVPFYIVAQLAGSILASGTLCLLYDVEAKSYFGTVPLGSNVQSLVLEIIITFLLMFVISGVSTDSRAIGELAGIAVGMTILLNVFVAGPVSGASMNPARSIGPAIAMLIYKGIWFKGIWVYIAGPLVGAIAGGFAYNLIRSTKKPVRELTKSGSFLKSMSRSNSF
ncbi:hypothetical protein HHK36_006806 [Tetracentron sinense]|uniref:Aquaporin NIP-type n=1 Tax=Tetracentron sinense TaxID=13715 RepID=A0A835DL89_TETSI|nr:hypothetical protein HHK36_006806 [Tetracentron sinense]